MEYNRKLTPRAQKLRREMTREERILWYQFLKQYPYRFRRQYVIDNYIVDFYCHKAKLVIELDGSQHYEEKNQEYDQIRTAHLYQLGIEVLRFSNLDILQRFEAVRETVHRTVLQRVEKTNC